jgi:hypothetical protein
MSSFHSRIQYLGLADFDYLSRRLLGGRASILVGCATTRRHYCGQATYPRPIIPDCDGTLVDNEVEAAAE